MKKVTIISLLALSLFSFHSYGQWQGSGNQKNVTWKYSFSGGPETITSSGTGFVKISTPAKQDFLPKPPTGEVKILTTEESGQGRAAFSLENGSLNMVQTSGRNLQAAPAKFVVKNFGAKSKVVSVHFDVTPNSMAENKQANWYFVIGQSGNSSVTEKGAPAITGYFNPDAGIYTIFRLRKHAVGGGYILQVRHNSGNVNKWAWQTVPGTILTNGMKAKIDLFFNNSDSAQTYSINGANKSLPAEAYHIYVNNTQKGASLTSMTRNYGKEDKSLFYAGDLTAFSISSREGAHSDIKNADGTIQYDNSASILLNNLEVNYLTTDK